MLIAFIGARSSGKSTIVDHLTTHHSFTRCSISPYPSSSSSSKSVNFKSSDDLLSFATSNWTHDLITTDLRTESEIKPFLKRPWMVLVLVQARLIDRWSRSKSNPAQSLTDLKFEEFVIEDDLIQFGLRKDPDPSPAPPEVDLISTLTSQLTASTLTTAGSSPTALNVLASHVAYTITNAGPLPDFLAELESVHLPKIRGSIRPGWDAYFIALANLASLRSNCMKRRVGAVIVTNQSKRVLSTGYNGTPRGMTNCNEGGCARCNGAHYSPTQLSTKPVSSCGVNLEECLCLHAEENALLEVGRDRITNSTLYCNTCPCLRCSIKIVQCGVSEVVYSQSYSMDLATTKIFLEAGIKLRQFG